LENYLDCLDPQTRGRYFDLLISIELQKNPEIPLSKWKVFSGLPGKLISEWKLNETFIFFHFFKSNSPCDAFEHVGHLLKFPPQNFGPDVFSVLKIDNSNSIHQTILFFASFKTTSANISVDKRECELGLKTTQIENLWSKQDDLTTPYSYVETMKFFFSKLTSKVLVIRLHIFIPQVPKSTNLIHFYPGETRIQQLNLKLENQDFQITELVIDVDIYTFKQSGLFSSQTSDLISGQKSSFSDTAWKFKKTINTISRSFPNFQSKKDFEGKRNKRKKPESPTETGTKSTQASKKKKTGTNSKDK